MEKSCLSDMCCIYKVLRNDSITKKCNMPLNKNVVLLINVGPKMFDGSKQI